MQSKTHYTGRYLSLVERNGWEFAARPNPVVAVLIAWLFPDTESDGDHRLLLVEQYREPVAKPVVELPAGLVGDRADLAGETVAEAAHRELVEETGYAAGRIDELMRCPTSAGMTNETAVFLAATELEQVSAGGGDASESITVHAIARDRIDAWLRDQHENRKGIDPKVFTALYWGPPA